MKQVTVLGLGPGNPALLTAGAVQALQAADLVIGAERLLRELPDGKPDSLCHAATRPDAILACLRDTVDWQSACVVLSGDLGLFSGAKALLPALATLGEYEIHTMPGISSAQYFAAKLQRPWQGWRFVSAHGVTCNIAAEAARGGEVFFVTGGHNTVAALCNSLCAAGFGEVPVTVGERLSYPEEAIHTGTAAEFAGQNFDELSVMLIDPPCPAPTWQWANTGIPDDAFVRGRVPMTKQEVRAAALAKLRIAASDVLYDIGAGTGSVTVEMALLARQGRVFAIERKTEAVELITQNAGQFGLHNVTVLQGEAPTALAGLPAPQAAFIGGSGGNFAGILDALRRANPAVRVCVACVTLQMVSEATHLLGGAGYRNFAACQIAVSRGETLGEHTMLKAQNPIFLLSAEGEAQ